MKKYSLLLAIIAIPLVLFAAGKGLQNEDFKTLTQLTSLGGNVSQLLNDTKIYVSAGAVNEQLSAAITDGKLQRAASILTTKGDVLTHNGTTTVRQAIGTDSFIATADSTTPSGWAWKTPPTALTTTKGDLAGFSTVPARVPAGADGTIPIYDSTNALGIKRDWGQNNFTQNTPAAGFSTSSASYVDVTGVTTTTTTHGQPVLIVVSGRFTGGTDPTSRCIASGATTSTSSACCLSIVRDGTTLSAICAEVLVSTPGQTVSDVRGAMPLPQYIDTTATAGAHTYKIQAKAVASGGSTGTLALDNGIFITTSELR